MFNYITITSPSEIFLQMGTSLNNSWDQFQDFSTEKKGEVIGKIAFDFLSLYFGPKMMAELPKELFVVVENTKFGENLVLFADSARKLGLKTKEGIKKLAGFKQQKQALDGLEGAAKHELYKKQLRQTMPKPKVDNPDLKRIVNRNYRPNAEIGSGSTADSIKNEILTGKPTIKNEVEYNHSQKGKESIQNIQDWLSKNPNASSTDKSAAEQIMLDLMDALGDI